MKLLVTGLCLQGNKGGPALALALMAQLRTHLGADIAFVFSVPGGAEYAHEAAWAERYGVTVVERISRNDLLPPFCVKGFRQKLRRVRRWLTALRACDLVLDLSAISYVGPPLGTTGGALWGRFLSFAMACLHHKPFLAWTQSYGPFSTAAIRVLARVDLSRQPIVCCRGEDCAHAVQALLPGKPTAVYPDVATVLDYDLAEGRRYFTQVLGLPDSARVITISPSAVIYAKTARGDGDNAHVALLSQFCQRVLTMGFTPVLVPHTLRPGRPNPRLCDYAVALEVRQALASPHLTIVDDDLSPRDLKAIISGAHIHVGARYHSIIAALSAGVPCISLSWHAKYRDIMRMYGMDAYVVDGLAGTPLDELLAQFAHVHAHHAALHTRLVDAQRRVADDVEHNSRLCAALIQEVCA